MAYARRSPQHQDPPSLPARKYPLRRSPPRRRRNNPGELRSTPDIRQVLVPLHPNLRRLPSRLHLAQSIHPDKQDSHMARHASQAGTKRKRVVSVNAENLSHTTRARARSKRLRSDSYPSTRRASNATNSEEEEQEGEAEHDVDGEEGAPSEMDVDASTARGSASEGSDEEADEQVDSEEDADEDEEEDEFSDHADEDDSTDDHLLNSAQPKQLSRLRKHDLIRLYGLAGLSDDAGAMTKSDIINAIVSARDDFASLPPSSPPRGDGNSSDGYSSDDGNIAGDEETDTAQGAGSLSNGHMGLRRRATMGEVKTSSRPLKSRSVSMGHLLPHQSTGQRRSSGRSIAVMEGSGSTSRRRSSNLSTPTSSNAPSTSSPLATRLRSRKPSGSSAVSISTPIAKAPRGKGKGKGKQVEFTEEVVAATRPSRRARDKQREHGQAILVENESDLTELEELEASLTKPSPRRLRSKHREAEEKAGESSARPLRKTPMRTAKGKIISMKESDDDEDAEDDVEESEEDELGEEEDAEGEVGEDAAEEEEVDELVSSASGTPVLPTVYKGRRTPVRTRLRPRQRHAPPPSDGDDEGEDIEEEEEMEEEAEEGGEEEDGEGEVEEEVIDGDAEGEDDEETIAVEPRKLRNGKIVGEEDVDMDEDIGDDDEADEAEDDDEAEEEEDEAGGDETAEEIDVDAEGENEEDEAMEAEDDG
ncbi:hypothetical protein DXG03_005741 [Asterophora parasitica]|uniref:Uncharacterized protein n=1 Tax=Asterophora parasitica TaxID=117018 RepID=A0A9P7GBC4_9AGAR|nr:hypothetical protein DXG03_005741 [Asterophora parasitica]